MVNGGAKFNDAPRFQVARLVRRFSYLVGEECAHSQKAFRVNLLVRQFLWNCLRRKQAIEVVFALLCQMESKY